MKNLPELRGRVHQLRQQLAQAEYDLRSAENEVWDGIQKQREEWMRMQQTPAAPQLWQDWYPRPVQIGDAPGWSKNGAIGIGAMA